MKRNILMVATIAFALILAACSIPFGKEVKRADPDMDQIKNICNLATIECYYHNVAKSTKEKGTGFTHLFEKDRAYWIEYTGTVKIGIDLSEVDMKVEEYTVTITIPEARILSYDKDESSMNFIIEEDGWNKNEITVDMQEQAVAVAQKEMINSVENTPSIMRTAQERAKDMIKNYINMLGDASGVTYDIKWNYVSSSYNVPVEESSVSEDE